jgi:hypothetical protein
MKARGWATTWAGDVGRRLTGLAVDRNDNVWVHNRPNDLTDIELEAELTPPVADCCVRPPSMIHIDKNGNVIGSFDAPQGHGMDVDSKGFVHIGQSVHAFSCGFAWVYRFAHAESDARSTRPGVSALARCADARRSTTLTSSSRYSRASWTSPRSSARLHRSCETGAPRNPPLV